MTNQEKAFAKVEQELHVQINNLKKSRDERISATDDSDLKLKIKEEYDMKIKELLDSKDDLVKKVKADLDEADFVRDDEGERRAAKRKAARVAKGGNRPVWIAAGILLAVILLIAGAVIFSSDTTSDNTTVVNNDVATTPAGVAANVTPPTDTVLPPVVPLDPDLQKKVDKIQGLTPEVKADDCCDKIAGYETRLQALENQQTLHGNVLFGVDNHPGLIDRVQALENARTRAAKYWEQAQKKRAAELGKKLDKTEFEEWKRSAGLTVGNPAVDGDGDVLTVVVRPHGAEKPETVIYTGKKKSPTPTTTP
jgi:hypothetical protein